METTTSYLSFERLEAGGFDGLIRFDGAKAKKVIDGSWVVDSQIVRRLIDPGADGPDRIDERTAGELAKRYGVEL